MIHDLINLIRDAGVTLPDNIVETVEANIRRQYGGERIYIQRHPKRQTQREIARIAGISVRSVRRVQRGK